MKLSFPLLIPPRAANRAVMIHQGNNVQFIWVFLRISSSSKQACNGEMSNNITISSQNEKWWFYFLIIWTISTILFFWIFKFINWVHPTCLRRYFHVEYMTNFLCLRLKKLRKAYWLSIKSFWTLVHSWDFWDHKI